MLISVGFEKALNNQRCTPKPILINIANEAAYSIYNRKQISTFSFHLSRDSSLNNKIAEQLL